MAEDPEKKPATWTEEMMVAGSELLEQVKRIVEQGNVRRIIIKKPTGDILVEIPLTAGVVAGSAMILIAPVLAALGALAALLAEVKLEIVRDKTDDRNQK